MKICTLFLLTIVTFLAGCSGTVTTPEVRATLDPHSATGTMAGALPISDADLPAPMGAAAQVPGGIFVDLGQGRLTRVAQHARIRVTLTGEEPGDWVELTDVVRSEVTGTVERNGLVYAVVDESSEDHALTNWFRQDRSGLYLYQEDLEPGRGASTFARGREVERAPVLALDRAFEHALAARVLDASGIRAFRGAYRVLNAKRAALESARGLGMSAPLPLLAGPPGGAGRAEITMLRYPMRPGAQWEGREGFNVWTVEALENLSTAAGRFRTGRLSIVVTDAFGPNDRALTWWGIPGEVKRAYHLEGVATDEGGNDIGRFEFEETYRLLEYVPGGAL